MLQRIQTIYFIIAMLLFGSLFGGLNFLRFESSDGEISTLDIFGRSSYYATEHGEKYVSSEMIPLFIFGMGMILLLFITMMSYKKIARQLNLARLSMLLNAFFLVLFVAWSTYLFFDAPADWTNSVEIGFYLLCCTLPFTYFAYKGVLKDKLLLDSIDRLR
jgi:amino acid transporter